MKIVKMRMVSAATVAFVSTAILAASVLSPAQAQVAVAISQQDLQASLTSCGTPTECEGALDAFIEQLVAANPDVERALIIASVMSALANLYNSGAMPANLAQMALNSMERIASRAGLPELVRFARQAAGQVLAGDPIDIEAVAEASASPA